MAYRHFFVLLLVAANCVAFDEPRRVIDDHIDGDDQLGYFIKTVKQESDREKTRKNAAGREGRNIEFTLPGEDLTGRMTVSSLDPREGHLQDFSVERVKNDSALPLHVISSARQKCLEGYQVDENGTCQKTLAPKGEKSFLLRRRKRGEQPQPKLSYADVVKFGRNRPLTIPFKAEILTTTPRTVEAKSDISTVVTTIKSMPSESVGITTPTAVTGKVEALTTLPTTAKSSHATVKAEATPTAVTGKVESATTLPTTVQSNHAVGRVEGTPSTTSAIVSPSVASVKKDEPAAITLPTPKSAISEAMTISPQTVKPEAVTGGATTPVNKAGLTTVPTTPKSAAAASPSPVPTKPSGLVIPTILTKIPDRMKSILGDLNRAFLSGEKQSILSQSSNGNRPPSSLGGKSPDSTRLRRWIRNLSEKLFRLEKNL